MDTIIVLSMIAITIIGLILTQSEATDRELQFLIKYHDIFDDSTH